MEETNSDILKKIQAIYYRRKPYIFFPFFILTPLIGAIGVFIPKTYQSSTTILVERQKISTDYVKSTVTTSVEQRLRTITQQVMSPNRLRKVLRNLNAISEKDLKKKVFMSRLIANIQSKIKIDVGKEVSFKITFSGKNPTMVMKITNQIASLFIEENLKLSEQQAQSTSEFLSSELSNVQRQLQEQEEKLRMFKQKYMGELPNQLETNLRTLDRIQMQLQTTQGLLKSAFDQVIMFEQQLSEEQKRNSIENRPNSTPKQDPLVTRLQNTKARLLKIQSRYKSDWPEVKRLKKTIAQMESQLAVNDSKENAKKENKKGIEEVLMENSPYFNTIKVNLKTVNRRIAHLKQEEKSLLEDINKYKKRVENIPRREEELISLTRDYTIHQKTYHSLLDKKLNAKLSENLEKKQKGENFIILDPAEIPLVPHFPTSMSIILAALGGGIGLSCLLVYLIELSDHTYKDLEEVELKVAFPIIGTIPKIKTPRWKRKRVLRQTVIIILLLVYWGSIGWIVLNRKDYKKALYTWGIIRQTHLI